MKMSPEECRAYDAATHLADEYLESLNLSDSDHIQARRLGEQIVPQVVREIVTSRHEPDANPVAFASGVAFALKMVDEFAKRLKR